jgi:hypothetical protein
MTGHLNNSDNGDICRSITWQFDDAPNVSGIIKMLKDIYGMSTEEFFDGMIERIYLPDLKTDGTDDYGLSVWGKILNLPRPIVNVSGTLQSISSDFYKKLLLGRIRLLEGNASVDDYCDYIKFVYDGKVTVDDGRNMGLTFTAQDDLAAEKKSLINSAPAIAFAFPAGVFSSEHADSPMFALDGQQNNTTLNVGGLDESSFNWRLTPEGNWQ